MKRILDFYGFINESSAAGNMDKTYSIPFKYSSNDPRDGYNSKSFVSDLESVFIEKPHLKKEIIGFLSTTMKISSIDQLEMKPFSEVSKIIPEIERIIEAGEYEPESIMPGGANLFIRNKTLKNGKGADFYINNRGTKIEVVTDDDAGKEVVYMFRTEKFPFDRFEFTQEEKDELRNIIDKKKVSA